MSDAAAEDYSTNERAERVMGRRLTPEDEERGIIAIDMPCELGYQCPVHRREWDETLGWSEYNSFLWCADCNRDWPTALCVPIDADPAEARRDWNVGPDAAVSVYLDTIEGRVGSIRIGAFERVMDALKAAAMAGGGEVAMSPAEVAALAVDAVLGPDE